MEGRMKVCVYWSKAPLLRYLIVPSAMLNEKALAPSSKYTYHKHSKTTSLYNLHSSMMADPLTSAMALLHATAVATKLPSNKQAKAT